MSSIRFYATSFLLSLLMVSASSAVPVVDTIDFRSNIFFDTDSDASATVAVIEQSFMDGGPVLYDLKITITWLDEATGLPTGAAQVGTFTDAGNGIGIETTTGGTAGNDNSINALNGNTLLEAMTFEVINLPATYSFDGFSNPVIVPTTASNADFVGAGTTVFTAQAASNSGGFKMQTLDATFQAVPEPSQWAMLGLIGIAFGAKRFGKRFLAA